MSARKGAIGAVDQAVLSLLSFAIGVVLVKFAAKEEYGLYSLCVGAILLGSSIQNALIVSPLLTLGPRQGPNHRNSFVASVATMGGAVSIGLSVVLTACFVAYVRLSSSHEREMIVGVALAVAVWATLVRELVRGLYFVNDRIGGALRADVSYSSVAVIAFLVLGLQFELTAAVALFAIAAGGIVSASEARTLRRKICGNAHASLPATWFSLWGCGKWALPSVVISWVYSNAYVYFVAASHGAGGVAELSAARLLASPISFFVAGWTNYMRPRAADLARRADDTEIGRIAGHGVVFIVVGSVVYILAIWFAYPILAGWFLTDLYGSLLWMTLAWVGYFTAFGVRAVGMAWALSVPAGFRAMFLNTLMALGLVIPLLVSLDSSMPLVLVPTTLLVAEMVLGAVVWWTGIRPHARDRLGP